MTVLQTGPLPLGYHAVVEVIITKKVFFVYNFSNEFNIYLQASTPALIIVGKNHVIVLLFN